MSWQVGLGDYGLWMVFWVLVPFQRGRGSVCPPCVLPFIIPFLQILTPQTHVTGRVQGLFRPTKGRVLFGTVGHALCLYVMRPPRKSTLCGVDLPRAMEGIPVTELEGRGAVCDMNWYFTNLESQNATGWASVF